MKRVRTPLVAAAVLLAVGLLVPAAADWLVTRDGSRVETDGPWRVESRLVVFKRPDGTLGSLRLSEVDLEASRRLTAEMAAAEAAPPREPEPPKRPVIARLTERDLPPVEARDEEAGGGVEEEAAPEEPSSLDVVSFQEISGPDTDGVAFRGTVQNRSEHTAIGIAVSAVVYGENGEEVRRVPAVLTASALRRGQSAAFRASFPGVYHYTRVEFDVSGRLLETAKPETADSYDGTGTEPPPGR